jgi:uncharacterized phage-associated protein
MATAEITFLFDETKAIETILYLSNRISESCKYNICKMLYFADKISLEKCGRFIFGETYSALAKGAIPSKAYDLLKQIADTPIEALNVEGNDIIPLRDARLEYLSKSDIECLNQAIEIYDNNPIKMKADAHDSAWQKAWDNRGDKKSSRISIRHIAQTLNDSESLIDYLTNHGLE